MTYSEVCKEIKRLEEYESIQSIANDSYYLSYDYKETNNSLYRLRKLKKDMEENGQK